MKLPDGAARERMQEWMLGASSATPLAYWRMFVGTWLAVSVTALAGHSDALHGPHRLFDAELVARVVPGTRMSVLRHPLVEAHPWIAWALGESVAACLILGCWRRISAVLALAMSVSLCRALYPLSSSLEHAGAHMTFWLMLMPTGRVASGTKSQVAAPRPPRLLVLCCLISTLIFACRIDQRDPEVHWLATSCAITVACMAAALRGAGHTSAAQPLGLASVAGATVLWLMIARLLSMPFEPGTTALRLREVLRDVGLDGSPLGTDLNGSPVIIALSTQRPVPTRSLWPRLFRQERIWSYLLHAPAAHDETPLQRMHLQGSLRHSLAQRACARGAINGVIEVSVKSDDRDTPLFRFQCAGPHGHLLPVPVDMHATPRFESRALSHARKRSFERRLHTHVPTPAQISSYLEDAYRASSRPPIAELLKTAQLRYALREFQESMRLIQIAWSQASPQLRQKARLDELYEMVERDAHRSGE